MDPDNNLISHEFFKHQLSWVNPGLLWQHHRNKSLNVVVRNEVLIITSPNSPTKGFIWPLNIGYETADRFHMTFEYRLKGKGVAALSFGNPIKKLPGGVQRQELKPAEEWTKFDRTFKWVPESCTLNVSFSLPKKGAKLEVKNLQLVGLEPEKSSKIPVVLAGKAAAGIYYLKAISMRGIRPKFSVPSCGGSRMLFCR